MANKPLGFGLIAGAIIALVIGLFITPHEAGAPHVIGFYVLLGAGAIVLAMGKKAQKSPQAVVPEAEPPSLTEAPDTAKALPKASLVAGAAVGAAAAASGLVASREETPASSDDRLLEDLERDLFSDLAPAKPVVDSPPEPQIELPVATEPLAEAVPDFMPEESQPEPSVQPVHGLLPDADLAALQAGEDPLPPLETLEIVGAYDSAGTRFTMYSDGSVTAFGPDLDRRFKSLDALRAYIDKGK